MDTNLNYHSPALASVRYRSLSLAIWGGFSRYIINIISRVVSTSYMEIINMDAWVVLTSLRLSLTPLHPTT